MSIIIIIIIIHRTFSCKAIVQKDVEELNFVKHLH